MIPLAEIVSRYGDRPLFLGEGDPVSYRQFSALVDSVKTTGEILQFGLTWSARSFALFLAGIRDGRCLVPVEAPIPERGLDPFLDRRPLLVLPTGGTTGQPRHAVHSVETLLAPYRIGERPESRLLVLYAADHIAGLDTFLQALYRGGSLVVPPGRDPQAIARTIEEHQVQVLPATPSFLNFLALSGALEGRCVDSVHTIPHGAEPMPEGIRRRIQGLFPKARLIQRFGMTELGALPVQPDPEDPRALFLEGPGYGWRVVDGQLEIRSPSRMLGTLEEGPLPEASGWHRTGDLAEETGRGSLLIIGRREGLINVGGEKVLPERIEALLAELPMVLDAAVEGIPNPLTGQAVAAKVVFSGQPDAMGLLRAMRQLSRQRGLSLAHVPTRVEPVQSVPETRLGKKARRQVKS